MKTQQKPQQKRNRQRRPVSVNNGRYPIALEHISLDVLERRLKSGRTGILKEVDVLATVMQAITTDIPRCNIPGACTTHRIDVAELLSVLNYGWKQVHNEVQARRAAGQGVVS